VAFKHWIAESQMAIMFIEIEQILFSAVAFTASGERRRGMDSLALGMQARQR